jgi:hypothetical protein
LHRGLLLTSWSSLEVVVLMGVVLVLVALEGLGLHPELQVVEHQQNLNYHLPLELHIP